MTQVILNINSGKKWETIEPILDAMEIAYEIVNDKKKISDKELTLLNRANEDIESGRLKTYANSREILGRN
jgi:hypothetical protein